MKKIKIKKLVTFISYDTEADTKGSCQEVDHKPRFSF